MRRLRPCTGAALDYALIALMAVSFSSASIFVLLSGLPGPSAATWRLVISSAVMWVLLLGRRAQDLNGLDGSTLAATIASGALLALHFDLWMSSLYIIPVGVSVAIVDSYPAFIWALGSALFKERYTPLELVGSALTVLGVVGLALAGGDPSSWLVGVLLSLGGMASMVGYVILGRWVRGKWSTTRYAALAYSFAAIVSLAVAALSGTLEFPVTPRQVGAVLGLVALPMFGGHTVMNYMLGRRKILPSTIAMSFEPAGASLLAFLVFGQRLTGYEWLMIAVTTLGIILCSIGLSKTYE
ncbi:MAG: DMT family transporter [Acidilobus sp.]